MARQNMFELLKQQKTEKPAKTGMHGTFSGTF